MRQDFEHLKLALLEFRDAIGNAYPLLPRIASKAPRAVWGVLFFALILGAMVAGRGLSK
jgi:hypothetical protein